MSDMKIIEADCGIMPKSVLDAPPVVTVTYEDHSTEKLFSYFADEIQFTPADFLGLGRDEALELRLKKDLAYLKS